MRADSLHSNTTSNPEQTMNTYIVSTTHGTFYVNADCEYEASKFAMNKLRARYPGQTILQYGVRCYRVGS